MRLHLGRGSLALVLFCVGIQAGAEDDELQEARQKEVARALSGITNPVTPYDYLEYSVDGTAVILDGFSSTPTLPRDAERAVRRIEWVTRVDDRIDFHPADPAAQDLRRQILKILMAHIPEAYPTNRAHVLIHVAQDYSVTLVGWIAPVNQARLETAVVSIRQLPLVTSVTNDVQVETSAR